MTSPGRVPTLHNLTANIGLASTMHIVWVALLFLLGL